MYQWIRRGAAGTLVLAVILWGLNLWYGISLPNQYYVSQGEDLVLTQRAVVAVENVSDQQAVMSSTHPQNQTLSLFGIMPIKTVAVQECQDLTDSARWSPPREPRSLTRAVIFRKGTLSAR